MTGYNGLAAIMSETYPVLIPQPADPDFPIEGVKLTGIGYVEGKLHIQYAVENALNSDNHGFFSCKMKQERRWRKREVSASMREAVRNELITEILYF